MKKLLSAFILSLFVGSVYAQQSIIEVKGTITEASTGISVPGATVIEKGTSNGTASDFDGNFTINVSSDAILVVSFMGFVTQEVQVNGRTSISISLEEDIASLDEVVVVGYSSQKRESLTGALNTVKGDDLRDVTTPSIISFNCIQCAC
ncbi:carboxypeptidase-like regulatory domain-containing protein [Gelidibacter japonicus]|uniref:carboxypeptidase-like regulatory domain-containing protein n=1 Tax=Gelidibacter japonicus TaxID=1962232 RepID=UPI003A937B76